MAKRINLIIKNQRGIFTVDEEEIVSDFPSSLWTNMTKIYLRFIE